MYSINLVQRSGFDETADEILDENPIISTTVYLTDGASAPASPQEPRNLTGPYPT
jgi:hypothetical protein